MARTIRLVKGAQFRQVATTPEGPWYSRWYTITHIHGNDVRYESDARCAEYAISRADLRSLIAKGHVEFPKGS